MEVDDIMGRPLKEIDPKKVRSLAGMGLSVDEIAEVMECSARTLQRRYVTALKGGRTRLNASLKRTQFRMAKTNVAMAIWLGKQYLGQVDRVTALAPAGDFNVTIVRPSADVATDA